MPYLSDRVDTASGHDHDLALNTNLDMQHVALTQQEQPRGDTVFPRKYRWPYQLPTFNGGPLHQSANRQSTF